MKDSGIKWIGEIPEKWGKCRLKNVITIENGKEIMDDGGNIPVYGSGGIFKFTDRPIFVGQSLLMGRKGTIDKPMLVDGPFWTVDTMFYTSRIENINARFLYYACSGLINFDFYKSGSVLPSMTQTELYNVWITLPGPSEQQAIAAFLDKKCFVIDNLISNETKQIEKLKEYRQAIITKAVTKGLDPSVQMKDSGVEWIEKIPETWKVYPLKSMFSFGKGLPITKENLIPAGEKVISYGQLHAKYNISISLVPEMFRYVSNSYLQSNPECIVHKGDFIMADTSEDREGTCDFVHINSSDLIFAGYHSIILRANNSLYSEYFAYLFLSDYWRDQFRRKVGGVKLFSLTKKMLSTGSVILPPEEDLYKIVAYLNSITLPISQVIDKKTSQIRCLEDYKKSLIYEYVTGKKRVSL